jgi:hypothetical protein
MIGISWTFWIVPSGIMLIIGAVNSNVVDVGSAIVLLFTLGSLGAISHAIFNEGFSEKSLRYSSDTFNNFPAMKMMQIVFFSFLCGLFLGVTCATGYLKADALGDQWWYWILALALIALSYRNFVSGLVRSDDKVVTVSHLFFDRKVAKEKIVSVEVVATGGLFNGSKVALKLIDGSAVYIPRLRFYPTEPKAVKMKPKLASALEHLSRLTVTSTIGS